MWSWFNCYLSGRHDFGMWCEPGAIFLRCVHCGRRSSGWALDAKAQTQTVTAAPKAALATPSPGAARVLPFDRAAAAR